MAEYDTHIVDGKRFNLAWTKIKELFQTVNTNVINLSTALNDLNTKHTNLSTSVSTLENSYNSLSTAVSNLQTNYTNLSTSVSALSTAVSNLQNAPIVSTFETITIGETTLTEAQLSSLLALITENSSEPEEGNNGE